MMKGTRYGAVIDPGSGTSSTLVWLLKQSADPSINMPKQYEVIVRGTNISSFHHSMRGLYH